MAPRGRSVTARLCRTAAWGALAAVLAAGPGAAPAGAHEGAGVGEDAVKAAFVYNFAKFATWPAAAFDGPQAPVVLCTMEGDPFGPAMAALAGKPVGPRRLEVRSVGVEEAGGCHVLFVGGPPGGHARALVRSVAGRPVLTVGDGEGFARDGGAIELYLEDGRVRFRVNLAALARSSVTLSSQVLRLAHIVEGAP